jgi:hypothetical protein
LGQGGRQASGAVGEWKEQHNLAHARTNPFQGARTHTHTRRSPNWIRRPSVSSSSTPTNTTHSHGQTWFSLFTVLRTLVKGGGGRMDETLRTVRSSCAHATANCVRTASGWVVDSEEGQGGRKKRTYTAGRQGRPFWGDTWGMAHAHWWQKQDS